MVDYPLGQSPETPLPAPPGSQRAAVLAATRPLTPPRQMRPRSSPFAPGRPDRVPRRHTPHPFVAAAVGRHRARSGPRPTNRSTDRRARLPRAASAVPLASPRPPGSMALRTVDLVAADDGSQGGIRGKLVGDVMRETRRRLIGRDHDIKDHRQRARLGNPIQRKTGAPRMRSWPISPCPGRPTHEPRAGEDLGRWRSPNG